MFQPLCRVRVAVPLEHVERVRSAYAEGGQEALLSDLEERVESVGFDDTLIVMQDPTDSTLFSLLTHRTNEPPKPDPLLRFASVEEVAPPPIIDEEHVPAREALDPGLSAEEILMVRQVLLEDTNPRHLNGVAHCFEPFFPVAASLLRTKADLLDIRKTPESKSDERLSSFARSKLRELWDRSQLPPSPALPPNDLRVLENAREALAVHAKRTRTPINVLHDEVRRAASTFVEDDPDELPKLRRFPPVIVNAAKLILVTFCDVRTPSWRRTLLVVDPVRLRAVIPPDPKKDGFVSPSAVQLALATSKPVASGVFKPIKAPKLYDDLLDAGGTPRGMKARAQMERANRLIERRRWVDWWRRTNIRREQTNGDGG